jgi:CheY-like chemotaxis protein
VGRKLKILGIDDNADLLQLSEIALTSGGYEYTGVDRGIEGVEEIRNGNYDLVLLDLSMPEMSGLDVIDALEKEGILNKQKIVVFTASPPTDEEIQSLLDRGIHSVIKKPLDVDVLLDHVGKIEAE